MRSLRIFFILILATVTSADAYHIAGGDLTAHYTGNNTFQITLTLFRDCSDPQGAQFDNSIVLAIYKKNNNQLYDTLWMNINNIQSIGLTGSSCQPPPEVCMEVGDYIRDIQLPGQPGGYYLVWERCCRNSSVININDPDAAGMAFYCEIADPALQSSSPVFNSPPSPYTCVGQLFKFPFEATDIDGDSLVYQMVTPLDGGHTSPQDPNPFIGGGLAPPPGPYSNITWASPFDVNNVTFSDIPVTLDPHTGMLEGSSDLLGIYAIAVVVYEYRNGVLIGAVRREIEFTVIPCNSNNVPVVTNSMNSLEKTINAGDTLCFWLWINDPDGDTMTITHSGELFESDPNHTIQAPYANSIDTIGIANVTVPFCWYSACDQSRDSAYIVTFDATDDGCPLPATKRVRISITVKPPPLPVSPNMLCMKVMSNDVIELRLVTDTSINEKYFDHYNIYRSINGSAFTFYRSVFNYRMDVYIDSFATANRDNNYCYAMSVVNRCGDESVFSDTLCSTTSINKKQNYLRTVTVEENQHVKMKWEDFPDGRYGVYHVYRRDNVPGSSADEIATLMNYSPMEYNDYFADVTARSYCYTLINEDVCGNLSPVSEELCTIHLKGNGELYVHDLNWNEFDNWRGGVDHYVTERSMSDISAFELLQNTTLLLAKDENLPVTGGEFRYRIRAVEGAGSYNEESLSNEIILAQQPLAWLPNAFSPNNDGKNDSWGIETAYVEDLELELFNRWGQIIWSTSDKTDRWNGQMSGANAPEGVYFYRMSYQGYFSNKKYEVSGRVTLIR